MSKHNDIYSILGKLDKLSPKQEPAQAKQNLNENASPFKTDLLTRLSESYIAEKDMGKHNNATTGFKALAKKAGGGEKGVRCPEGPVRLLRHRRPPYSRCPDARSHPRVGDPAGL